VGKAKKKRKKKEKGEKFIQEEGKKGPPGCKYEDVEKKGEMKETQMKKELSEESIDYK